MSPKNRAPRSRRNRPAAAAAGARGRSRGKATGPLTHRLATWSLWALLIAVPFVLDSAQKDAFRLPKALLAETLALLSLFFLAFAWKEPLEWKRLLAAPFVRTFGPYVALATLLSLTSPHHAHVYRGLAGLWIGALAIWGWSVGFSRHELREALTFHLVPASILSAIAILQFHGIYQPYSFIGIAQSSRFAIGSLAGNVGDLAACLVLPVLVAQADLARGKRVGLSAAALVLCLYGLVATQTFSAIAGAAAGTIVFWGFRISRRRAAIGVAAAAGLVVLLLALVGPFRERSVGKLNQIASGDWNSVLTGRLDGWRAAVWMLNEHPLSGVGVGAYRTEFIHAKTALLRDGVTFFKDQMNVVFANAHNEILEVAAETGWPGLAAFLFGLFLLVRRLLGWRRPGGVEATVQESPSDSPSALAWAGIAGIAVLSLAQFPFRIAIALWPICLFVAWMLADDAGTNGAPDRAERRAAREEA
jgi:O-antigen ligase